MVCAITITKSITRKQKPHELPCRITCLMHDAYSFHRNMTNLFCSYNFSLLLILLLNAAFSVSSDNHTAVFFPSEQYDLLQLMNSVNSIATDLSRNWTGFPCFSNNQSRWIGIGCSNGHVVSLVLEGIQLTGSLPPLFLQSLTFLNKLSLRNNLISGSLPNLSKFVNLEFVLLSQNRFTNTIPLEYTQLSTLKEIELQRNYLEGEIPAFNQSTLLSFNVSYNHLRGLIPPTQLLQRFPKSCYENNSGLCGSPLEIICLVPPRSPPSTNTIPIRSRKRRLKVKTWIVGLIAAAGGLVLLLLIFVFLWYCKKWHAKVTTKEDQQGDGLVELAEKKRDRMDDPVRRVVLEVLDNNIPNFDLDDLLRASSRYLGKGELGTTYKATLESGSVVVVKRVKEMKNGLRKKEFVQHFQLLGMIRHENIIKIVSFHYSKEEKLIIYDFAPHGNLFQLLHESRGFGRITLNWRIRFGIIKDIAKGLACLHQFLRSHKVPHGNLTSSNILIYYDHRNNNYNSKLSDFGFFSLLSSKKAYEKLAIGRAPECSHRKKMTLKADVYCFGIVLLEVVTGRIPGEISESITNDDGSSCDDLSEWVKIVVNSDWSTDIFDEEIVETRERHDEMLKLTELALECTDTSPAKRPNMNDVLKRIEDIEQGYIEESHCNL